ncbi:hypothetical protein A8C56_21750 [Niabella ginsenosidivorans]|uniref:Uncharacterized protein n=1 Tax=Niabella ginsenosidivorans TaxID=1176587 RepID=A0A1A9I9P2_9BACT|nr:hypothetical protein [Niabella ginsenosidivorans]ANH83254.1 hypothetical protein A8C56_21750 [Niabella ginsenosidivorans]
MKFRRGIILFIIGIILVAFFTKPGKDDFIRRIPPTVNPTQLPPVVEYQDRVIYATVTATYVDAANPVKEGDHMVAPARKEEYIGLFGRYWKLAGGSH